MFTVHITDLDNEAFAVDASAEIARILRELADRVDDAMIGEVTLRDINGNIVGRAALRPWTR